MRQGDPILPLLFGLCMEYLTRIFHEMTLTGFKFHKDCEELNLCHLCFADDLFLFANGDANSIRMIKRTLEHFQDVSRLAPNLQKSAIFFSGVKHDMKMQILEILGFKEGFLPIKYLGLPLILSRLRKEHCMELVSKITARISSLIAKTLSYAGKIQLVNSVLSSMYMFWCSIFFLPKVIIHQVEKICRNFCGMVLMTLKEEA